MSWAYTVTPGYLKKIGEDSSAEYHLPTGTPDSANRDKAALVDMWQSVMAKKNSKTLCVITVFSLSTCEDNMPFERTKLNVSSDSSFQQALLYNGRVGEKINIGYREYSGNMARPAFDNNVEHDLSESKNIGYKGARIEVIDATNQSIKYRMVSNLN